MEAWHFIREDRRMWFDDQDLIKVGQTYRVEGEPILCKHGLHASKRAIDALVYAPGPIICRVRLDGVIVEDTDKAVSTERTVLWMGNAKKALRDYALLCALSVAHRWDMPHSVRRYLETGDGILKAARATAWDAAKATAWAAAMDAAMAAAWNAAMNAAAMDAAWDAAWDAAREKQNIELEARLNAIPHMTK